MTLLLIGLVCPGLRPAFADDPQDELAARIEARQQREATATQRRLTQLQLSRSQARRLLPIVEQAALLQAEWYETQTQLLPDMVAAFTAFGAEDRLNQGFSRAVEARTGKINRQETDAREDLNKQLIALEEKAAKVLTPQQRTISAPASFAPASQRRERIAAATPDSPDERLADLRKELEALNALRHPQPGPLARCLFHAAAYEPLCEVAGKPLSRTLQRARSVYEKGTVEQPLVSAEQQRAEISRLRKEINNWNLINGLQLDQRQIEQIMALCAEAAGAALPKGAALAELEGEVEQVLNPGQRQVIADYKACLVPPKNLKDPVRVGQASDHSQYEQWLARARGQSEPALETAINEELARAAEHLGPLSKDEQQKRKALLRKTAHQAAGMSDTEFELAKVQLAQRIAPPDRAGELHAEIDRLTRERGLPGRVAKFMLNPEFIGQLRERGQQLAQGIERKSADLADGPQAENCDKGCALRPKKGSR